MQRNTRQREAIRLVFKDHPRPLRPEEIHELAQHQVPGLGLATVYRAVRDLCESGELVRVNLPDGNTHFERAGLGHHHHFYCRSCKKVIDFDGCPLPSRMPAPRGFRVDSHDLYLYGLCAPCTHVP